MPAGWFDQVESDPNFQGTIQGPTPAPINSAEPGGFSGQSEIGGNGDYATMQSSPQLATFGQPSPALPAIGATGQGFDPSQQVGHNGSVNGMNREQYRDAWQGSGAKSMADLQAFVSQHGGTINSANGTVTTPFGEQIDMLQGAHTNGNGSAAWGGMGGGGSAPAAAGGDGAAMPTANLAAYGFGGVGGGGSSSSRSGGGAIPGYTPFVAPTLQDAMNDPGYAFGLQQGSGLLQTQAAASGMLRDVKTAKALDQFGTDYATSKYNDVYNRALQGYNANTGSALGFGNLANAQQSTSNQFALGQGNLALGNLQANQSYDLGLRNNALGYTQAGNALTLGQGQLGLGWANYGLGANAQAFNQDYAFPIQTGLEAANATGGYGSAYAANGSGLITGAGNAAAAGQVGSANAWNGAAGTIGNTGLGLYYAHQYGNQ